LTGDAGNNVLDGNEGHDVLTGNSGADTFRFDSAHQGSQSGEEPPADTVTDFSSIEGDIFDLSWIDADTTVDGNQAFHFIGGGNFSNTAGELPVVANATPQDHVQIEGDIDGDGIGDLIVLVQGDVNHDWTADDFIM
jgi:Ca2+-binding RTX toxin-like protein